MPDNVAGDEPNGRITTKQFYEALMAMTDRLGQIEAARVERAAEMERRLMARFDELCLPALEEKVANAEKDIAHLETRVNTWSSINSIGVGIAVILDYFFGIRR